jgi:hypothetical protein
MNTSQFFGTRDVGRRCVASAALVAVYSFASIAAAAQPPAAAAAVGYTTNTFSSNFTATSVDVANSGKPGFAWYPWSLFGHRTNTSALKLNADTSITLMGDTTGPNGELVSATAANNAQKFVGTAFGGGAYIDGEIKFDPQSVANANTKGWPAFWSLAMEGSVLSAGNQWAGQPPGFNHSVEVDIFEYLYLPYGVPRNIYGAGMHDWYGIPNVTCARGLCAQHMQPDEPKRVTPAGTDFTQYHHFAFLWVPATDTSQGYSRFYFDGQVMGPDRRWTKFDNQPPPPTNQPWAFGRLDQQHLVLILGTGPNEPMTIGSVNVWQASDAGNLHQ